MSYTSKVEPLDETDSPWKYQLGAVVDFHDPNEGISSGTYTIIERFEGPGYLISNGRYNIETKEENLSL